MPLLASTIAAPALASGPFTVGSFTKSTSAAPVTQNVAHGLGVAPKAIILWTTARRTRRSAEASSTASA